MSDKAEPREGELNWGTTPRQPTDVAVLLGQPAVEKWGTSIFSEEKKKKKTEKSNDQDSGNVGLYKRNTTFSSPPSLSVSLVMF
jgi:hypothetical protein